MNLDRGFLLKLNTGFRVTLDRGFRVKLGARFRVTLYAWFRVKLDAGFRVTLDIGFRVTLGIGFRIQDLILFESDSRSYLILALQPSTFFSCSSTWGCVSALVCAVHQPSIFVSDLKLTEGNCSDIKRNHDLACILWTLSYLHFVKNFYFQPHFLSATSCKHFTQSTIPQIKFILHTSLYNSLLIYFSIYILLCLYISLFT